MLARAVIVLQVVHNLVPDDEVGAWAVRGRVVWEACTCNHGSVSQPVAAAPLLMLTAAVSRVVPLCRNRPDRKCKGRFGVITGDGAGLVGGCGGGGGGGATEKAGRWVASGCQDLECFGSWCSG